MSSRGGFKGFKGSSSARFVKNKRQDDSNQQQKNYNVFSRDAKQQQYQNGFNNNNNSLKSKLDLVKEIDTIDSVFGFDRFESGSKKTGWLVNMHPTTIPSSDVIAGTSGVDYYFLDEEGGSFKASVQYDPYFLLICRQGAELEVEEWLKKTLEGVLKKLTRVEKEDLALPNHLIGLKRTLLRLNFHNISDLLEARRSLNPIIQRNKSLKESKDIYSNVDLNYNIYLNNNKNIDDIIMEDIDEEQQQKGPKYGDASELIEDIREYDVPYHVRVSIDKNIRVGKWYTVEATEEGAQLTEDPSKIAFADPVVLAFDIETTKAPLKFPDSSVDQVMMISYMIDGDGYLITNREIISEDIDDFEYTPKPEYPGQFTIFNEENEKALLERFFEHIRDVKPTVIATFNGDFFDWPFVEARAAYHELDMFKEIGFAKDNEGEYKSNHCVHMDCFRWVKRDSYLPQGSQGLKAVTTVKLGYNPTELDPELMTPYAYEKPQLLSEYSVSDAVATYYLYYKYVHPFIFSLCTIIPLNPDEVLRKGTGTLCEMLLMVQAYEKTILLPNKHTDPLERFYDGHLLESETYVGGHVESLEAGVFRADLDSDFTIDPTAIDEVLADLDDALKFAITVEGKKSLDDVINYDEIYNEVKEELLELKRNPKRKETPLIYHVDVASMYPNIMCSNRLQPDSMKLEKDCAACDFNRPGKNCDRRLTWAWRGEYYPAEMNEYNMIKNACQNETFPPKRPGLPRRSFDELPYSEQTSHIKKRIADYSRKVYHRIKKTETAEREAIICQRENPFYVNTVRDFRDRRYEFKGLAKVWKGKASAISKTDMHSIDEAKKMIVLYDSMQLAHKVILNSFYGYVMRKGSRWYSMEMAGITCLTGATIIQMARALVERLGRPLELDTDGIWCILPKSFPENFNFKLKNGKSVFMSYPCSMLNYLVHQKFTNHQYQTLVDPVKLKYETHSDNSIFFEVDGPYKAMILPTSKEEGKGLKKRYAVFNFDGTLAELKGFELKRRGELQLIKNFQSDIFKLFLDGDTLEGCYGAVANIANRWLDVLETKGKMLEDEDLIELICQNRSMSKSLEEYGAQKSTSITTARRLGEFLGEEMVKDKGLACKYIIADRPLNAPITERAIPTAIFSSDLAVKRKYLRRWIVDPTLENFDPRSIIDWEYYRERLASVVQKIITIPAALQGVSNPVPRVTHPDWLQKKIDIRDDKMKQTHLTKFFTKAPKGSKPVMADVTNTMKDIEDFGSGTPMNGNGPKVGKVTSRKRRLAEKESQEEEYQRILNQPMPDPLVDYVGFLKYQKLKWKLQAQERQRRTKLFGNTFQTNDKSAMGSMIRRQAESFVTSQWQVIQYTEDISRPGYLKAFVLINGKVQTLSIHVSKKIYINFKSGNFLKDSIPNCEITKAIETLPNGQSSANLFKMVMSESTFNEQINQVGGILNDTSVAGIYESNIQATERAIMEIGTCVKFNEDKVGSLTKSLEKGFDQKNLKPLAAENYLTRFSMGILYLLHIVSNGYEIFALFDSTTSQATIYTLKPSANAQQLPANVSGFYQDMYNAKKDSFSKYYNIINYKEEVSFETHYFTDVSKIYKKLNSKISSMSEQSASKPLFVVQSPIADKLSKILKASSSLPNLKMKVNEIQLNALSWHSLLVKRILNHYLSLAGWVTKMISLAKYGNIPLCNLKVDNMAYLIDIEYARKLIESNIVLWWSPSSNPDYGGAEKDKMNLNIEETFEFPNVNKSEIYESVCIEFEIKNLTINTILTSTLINEAEGVFDDLNEDNSSELKSGTFAEDSFSGPALAALRSLVKTWWDDAIKNDANADSMIHGFIAWYRNPSSFLYDSSLHYHVHNLTKKSLAQVLGGFKKLGSSIIFADRNKAIIRTSKTQVGNSYAYGQYVISAIRSKQLFNFLELGVVRYWDMLIWMDQYNYCGSYCQEIEATDDNEQQLEFVSKWQIKNFLPPILQQEFEEWTLMILDALINHRSAEFNTGNNSKGAHGSQATPRRTQITQILKNNRWFINSNKNNDLEEEDFSKGVCEYFRSPLLKRIKTLISKQNETILNPVMGEDFKFPKLAGSYLTLNNPTLEMVKFICHVLSLSKRRNIEVRMLRKEILNLFEIKEFSEDGLFKNPSTSLIIPQWVCDYCNHTRDIDICKDDESSIWTCESCDKPFNKLIIEEKLIFEFNKLITKYLTQDYRCSKCSRARDNELSSHCSCSGSWTSTISKKEVLRRLKVYENVADAYQFKLLRDVTDSLLAH